MEASYPIKLQGDGTSADKELAKRQAQNWVMGTVHSQYPWDESFFVNRLGNYVKYKATLSHLHDAYYFPDVDVTLLVNRLRGEVTVWRFGRATR